MTSEPSRPNPFGALIEAQLQLLSMSNAFLEAALAKDGSLTKAAEKPETKTRTKPVRPQRKPAPLLFKPVAFSVVPSDLGDGSLCCEIVALDAAGLRVVVDRICAASANELMRALEACDVSLLCRVEPDPRTPESAGQALLRRARERQLAAKLRSAIEDAHRAVLELTDAR